jgi:hypothetical protein
MGPEETPHSPSPSLPTPAVMSIDIVSKSVAVFAIVLYGCGYLITSIYYSGYGFTETAPLRPRIVAAGAWFLLFTAAPFALVKGVLKSGEYLKVEGEWWFKAPTFLIMYSVACFLFAFQARWIFDLDTFTAINSTSGNTWQARAISIVFLLGFLVVGVLVLALLTGSKRVPRPLSAAATAGIVIYGAWSNWHDLFVKGYFGDGAISLWFFAVGLLAFVEMRSRSWKAKLGDWTWSTILLLGALLLFASLYYPHIKSSWGGGRPIPVTIYFKNESVILPGQSANALLIDETDSGFYVVGKNDKKATLIPRASVGLLYFSDNVSDFSLSKPK